MSANLVTSPFKYQSLYCVMFSVLFKPYKDLIKNVFSFPLLTTTAEAQRARVFCRVSTSKLWERTVVLSGFATFKCNDLTESSGDEGRREPRVSEDGSDKLENNFKRKILLVKYNTELLLY